MIGLHYNSFCYYIHLGSTAGLKAAKDNSTHKNKNGEPPVKSGIHH